MLLLIGWTSENFTWCIFAQRYSDVACLTSSCALCRWFPAFHSAHSLFVLLAPTLLCCIFHIGDSFSCLLFYSALDGLWMQGFQIRITLVFTAMSTSTKCWLKPNWIQFQSSKLKWTGIKSSWIEASLWGISNREINHLPLAYLFAICPSLRSSPFICHIVLDLNPCAARHLSLPSLDAAAPWNYLIRQCHFV